jgi:hypothetical protein
VNARERFTKGQRVRVSEIGMSHFGPGGRLARSVGVVVGFGREEHLVRVRRDGVKYAESYHEKFWEAQP